MLVVVPGRTVGPFTAINGKRLGLSELACQLFEGGKHLAAAGPRPSIFVALGLCTRTGSLIGCICRPPCSGCCRQRISPQLRSLRMTYFKNGVKRGSQTVLEGCHGAAVQTCARSGRLLVEQNWLSPLPFQMQPAFLRQPRLHNPSLCS